MADRIKMKRAMNPKKQDGFESFDDGYESDLMGDEADRAHLASLSEIEREQMIAERHERRQKLLEKHQLRVEMNSLLQKEKIGKQSSAQQQKESKQDAIRLMVLKRQQKKMDKTMVPSNQAANANKKVKKATNNSSEDEYDINDEEEDTKSDGDNSYEENSVSYYTGSENEEEKSKTQKPAKQQNQKAVPQNQNQNEKRKSSSVSSKNSDWLAAKDQDKAEEEPDNEQLKEKLEQEQKDDLERIRLSRDFLHKMSASYFFDEIAKGGFVRMMCQSEKKNMNSYFIGEVTNVVAQPDKPAYKIDPNSLTSKLTNKWLEVTKAKKTKLFKIQFVSNQTFRATEYAAYKESMKLARLPVITKQEIELKAKQIKRLVNRLENPHEIEQQVESNIRKKIKLLLEQESANCESEIKYIEGQITNLEDQMFETTNKRPAETTQKISLQLHTIKEQLCQLQAIHRNYVAKNKLAMIDPLITAGIASLFKSKEKKHHPSQQQQICRKRQNNHPNMSVKTPLEIKLQFCNTAEHYNSAIDEFLAVHNQKQDFSFDDEVQRWVDEDSKLQEAANVQS